jgi:hypothetical protein
MKTMEGLDERAVKRVSGPAWESLKPAFMEISEKLLAVSPDAKSELTTIYVKYKPNAGALQVFAVVWLKTSKKIVIGMSLPNDLESPRLGEGPQGTKYKGLTKYLTVTVDDPVPDELGEWAKIAYEVACKEIR